MIFQFVSEVPSSPEILQVEPFSSTAVVVFQEPNSLGGVPILKYRAEWRVAGQDWTGKDYNAEEGESYFSNNCPTELQKHTVKMKDSLHSQDL